MLSDNEKNMSVALHDEFLGKKCTEAYMGDYSIKRGLMHYFK